MLDVMGRAKVLRHFHDDLGFVGAMDNKVAARIKDDKIAMVDLRFIDIPGLWQHFSVPPSALDLDSFEDGVGFDGSSIRGFQEIQESDMLVIPDPASGFLDPLWLPIMPSERSVDGDRRAK